LLISHARRTRLEIAPQQFHCGRAGEAEAEKTVHGALLNSRPGFPARDGRFAHAQQVRELLLRQGRFLAALANLVRRQQSGRAAESGADLLIGLVVAAGRLAVAALRTVRAGTSTR